MSLDLRTSKNILRIGEAKVSKSKFMHTFAEPKSISAIDKKIIDLCLVKNVEFLLGR